MEASQFLTSKQAAAYCGMRRTKFYRFRKMRLFPIPYKLEQCEKVKKPYWTREQLDAWKQSQTVPNRPVGKSDAA